MITEVVGPGPSSRLEHQWHFGNFFGEYWEVRIEGLRSFSSDGDDFIFECSVDGVSWNPLQPLVNLPFADDNIDRSFQPTCGFGDYRIRVRDSDRTNGHTSLDSVSIDELFIRIYPQ